MAVPVLAIAPIVLVILGSLGFSGVAPKAVIAMYLCFFPVTVAMVQKVLAQGLRTPDIYSEGTTKVGTAQMGDAVVKALA